MILSDLWFWQENHLQPPISDVNKILVAVTKRFKITELMATSLNLSYNLFYLGVVLSSLYICFTSVFYHVSLWDINCSIVIWMNKRKLMKYQIIKGRMIYHSSILEVLLNAEHFFQKYTCEIIHTHTRVCIQNIFFYFTCCSAIWFI